MKLAIGSGVAFHEPLLRHGPTALERPEKLRGHLAWWKKQGVQGVVFYDAYPDFYQRPIEHFQGLKQVLDEVGLPVGAFNALRKSLFLPELADLDEKRTYRCLEVAAALGAEIFDLSVNVPLLMQRDPYSSATRQIFRGEYAPAAFYEEAARRLKPVAQACARASAAGSATRVAPATTSTRSFASSSTSAGSSTSGSRRRRSKNRGSLTTETSRRRRGRGVLRAHG